MTDKLPPNLLALFAPRPPLRWVPPSDYAPEERRTATIGGVGDFLPALKAYKDADNYTPTESWLEMKDRKKREKKAAVENLLKSAPSKCEFRLGPIVGAMCPSQVLTKILQSNQMRTQIFVATLSKL